MNEKDIQFLESLAERLSDAMYYQSKVLISRGIRHDDYDRLREIAKQERIRSLENQLAILKAKP